MMGTKPSQSTIGLDGLGESVVISELMEDEGGDVGVWGHTSEGFFWPETFGALEGGEVLEGVVDGGAEAAAAHESAETEGGGHGIAKAAIGVLCGEDDADHAGTEGGVGLVEFVEADDGHGGDGSGAGEFEGGTEGCFRAHVH